MSDLTTWAQTLAVLIKELGFPIVACVALFYLIYKLVDMLNKNNASWQTVVSNNALQIAEAIKESADKTSKAISDSTDRTEKAIKISAESHDKVVDALVGAFKDMKD